MWCPEVIFLNLLKSSGKCQRSWLSFPSALFSATAAISVIIRLLVLNSPMLPTRFQSFTDPNTHMYQPVPKFVCQTVLNANTKTRLSCQQRAKEADKWNPMSRARCYDLLASEFGLDTARPWTDKMRIGSGFISPTLSQWIVRVLVRCGYSVRKESISQSVPTNWLSVAVETSNSIRSTKT